MAALHFTRTAIFNISKGNIPRFTSISFPRDASRVAFTSASKHFQGKRVSEETNNGYNGDEAISYSDGNSSKDAKKKLKEGKDRMKEGAGEMKDISMDGMKEANEKMKEKVAEMRDKTRDAAETVAEKTKQTVAGAWDAAKGTSRKIKESVVGRSDDDDDDWGDDRRGDRKVMDEDPVKLRRKVGNLDHEKKDY